jgi:DNA-binding NtrC family response regulator
MSTNRSGSREGRPEIVVIDDDPLAIDLIRTALQSRMVDVVGFTHPEPALTYLEEFRAEVIFLDLHLPDLDGFEVMNRILCLDPTTHVVLTSGEVGAEFVVSAIQQGAVDYWTKPLRIARVVGYVDKWLVEHNDRLILDQDDSTHAQQFDGAIGNSPAMLQVYSRIRRVAKHFRTVLVRGETGTGKELAAASLHRLSPRSDRPLLICNCAALVENLADSELFGHVRGAFTGATQDRIGLVKAADGGTLFLDEIGELPMSTQAKLLRVVQNREVRRVGATSTDQVDVNVVAATNRDLLNLSKLGAFREDLYYRLSAVEILLPRLEDRGDDLKLLVQHFLGKFSNLYSKPGLCLTRRAMTVLGNCSWPGNVRELENVLSTCAMLAETSTIDVEQLPVSLRQPRTMPKRESSISMAEVEYRHVQEIVAQFGGNVTKAAEVLGIGRTTIYRILRRPCIVEIRSPNAS